MAASRSSKCPRDDFAPFVIGRRFRICPPAVPATGSDHRLELVMQRGAFGSGEHETTASCIEVLEGLAEARGAKVLDLGSGTGILALVALKLGAREATCADVDRRAVAVARENGRLNGLQDRLRHIVGSVDSVRDRDFAIVLANLYGDLLIDLAGGIAARVCPGGLLLLSGMLWEYCFEVRRTYERLGFAALETRMLEEFCTTLLRKE